MLVPEYASKCLCLLYNVGRFGGEGAGPWRRAHGTDFKGKLFQIVRKLYFKLPTANSYT